MNAINIKLRDFILKSSNAAPLNDAIISREVAPNGCELIRIICEDNEIYQFWNNPEKKPPDKPPKHIGGKKPYIMLMIDEVKKLKDQKVKNAGELLGCLVYLAEFVEWGTGRLIKKRSKKPIRYKDLLEILPYGNSKLNHVLTDLKKYGLLSNSSEGYFISDNLIKKGKKTNKEAVRDGH